MDTKSPKPVYYTERILLYLDTGVIGGAPSLYPALVFPGSRPQLASRSVPQLSRIPPHPLTRIRYLVQGLFPSRTTI